MDLKDIKLDSKKEIYAVIEERNTHSDDYVFFATLVEAQIYSDYCRCVFSNTFHDEDSYYDGYYFIRTFLVQEIVKLKEFLEGRENIYNIEVR